MPDIEPSEFVEITHFINPHAFWLRKCNAVDNQDFHTIECELQTYALKKREKSSLANHRRLRIVRDDCVVVYFVAWSKWLRCNVDVIDAKGERCILWAIDYGFPLQSSIDLIVLLENVQLAQKCSNLIMKAAISTVLPFKNIKNRKSATRLTQRERWSSEAVDVLAKIKEKKIPCKFALRANQVGETHLGDLFICAENGQIKSLSDALIGMNLAKPINDMNELKKSFEKTTKMNRWISNANDIHPNCILNEGDAKILFVCEPEANVAKMCRTPPNSVIVNGNGSVAEKLSDRKPKAAIANTCQAPIDSANGHDVKDGAPDTSSCSEDDVLKFFKVKQRNAQIAKLRLKTIDDAFKIQQEKRNKSIISNVEPKATKPSVPVALAYTSLNKGNNVAQKRPESDALAEASGWWANDETRKQNGETVANGLKIESGQGSGGESKRMRISDEVKPQEKNDFRHTGEREIQTTLALARILAHSENIRIKPVHSIGQAPFSAEVHRFLKDRYCETYTLQSYAWPHLMRGNSLILVDSKNRGKSIAYLPAMCSRLQFQMDESSGCYNKTQLKMGPKAIILCANASSVEKTADFCRRSMNRIETEVVQAIGSRNIRDVAAKLFNGCSIFVTTAPCLSNLMKSHSDVFCAQKLSFFVFDNADMIISRYGEEQLATIFKKFCTQDKGNHDMPTLVVATARTWHPALQRMRERMSNPLLLIGNFLEAARYGNMDIQVLCNFGAKKIDLVHEHIKSLPIKTERLLIICNESAEANELSAALAEKELPHKCVTKINPNNKSSLGSLYERYWRLNSGIFICTDETLKELKILNAQHVIQFSMPERFTDFLFRLSSSLNCYPNLNAKLDQPVMGRTSTLFLVDERNNKQLPKLINLLERKGEKFAENVLEICQQIRILNDNEKAEKCRLESICNFLFMHGRSNHESSCRERHLLMPSDVPLPDSAAPRSGGIRLKILNIFSPTRYAVRLLTKKLTVSPVWEPINQSDAYMDFNRKFNKYYSDSSNIRDLLTTEMDKLCAIEDNNGPSHAFHRGRIILINEKKSLCADDFDVDIRLIDVGTIVRRKSTELRQLAAEFFDFPEQAIDLHLIGLVPADAEDEWDSEITQKLRNHLEDIDLSRDDIHVEANIVFSLRKAVVVDCLRITQVIGRDCSILCSVKKHMIDRRLGIGAKGTRKDIIKMAGTIGIEMQSQYSNQIQDEESPTEMNGHNSCNDNASVTSDIMAEPKTNDYTTKNDDKKSVNLMEFSPTTSKSSSRQNLLADAPTTQNISAVTDAPDEKWVTISTSSFVECEVSHYISPDHFCINLPDDGFIDFLEQIDKYVEKYDDVDTSMEMPDIGNYCLVKFDGKYNRGKILSNFCENGIFCAKVFCCDMGLVVDCEIENVMSIPDELLNAMPFQAIWCRLYGIRPTEATESEWSKETSDKIYDDIINTIRNLTAQMISVHGMKPLVADGPFEMQQFNVVLRSSDLVVNRIAVDRGWAVFEHGAERKIDETCALYNDADDDESEDDEWKMAGAVLRMPPQKPQPQMNSDLLEAFNSGLLEVDFDMKEFAECVDESMRGMFHIPQAVETEMKNFEAQAKKAAIKDEPEVAQYDSIDSTRDNDNYEENTITQHTIKTLQYKHQLPYVTWQQSDELIMLSIKADENVVYNLDVTSRRLIFNAEIRGEPNLLILHFFGSIDAEYTSHEIRGLNVIVRLMKTIGGWVWPQLTVENVKCHWLHYDYNAIKSDDIYLDKAWFEKENEPILEDFDSDDYDSDSGEESNSFYDD